jgi:hypothetical protein
LYGQILEAHLGEAAAKKGDDEVAA